MEIIEIKKDILLLGVISGDYGKPRPVVVQSNLYKNHPSITVCLHNVFNR